MHLLPVPTTRGSPWNEGKLVGAMPRRPSHVWSIGTKLQIEGNKVLHALPELGRAGVSFRTIDDSSAGTISAIAFNDPPSAMIAVAMLVYVS